MDWKGKDDQKGWKRGDKENAEPSQKKEQVEIGKARAQQMELQRLRRKYPDMQFNNESDQVELEELQAVERQEMQQQKDQRDLEHLRGIHGTYPSVSDKEELAQLRKDEEQRKKEVKRKHYGVNLGKPNSGNPPGKPDHDPDKGGIPI